MESVVIPMMPPQGNMKQGEDMLTESSLEHTNKGESSVSVLKSQVGTHRNHIPMIYFITL